MSAFAYLSADDYCQTAGINQRELRRRAAIGLVLRRPGSRCHYEYLWEPPQTESAQPIAPVDHAADVEAKLISNAPRHQRERFEKWAMILPECEGLAGKALRKWIAAWNQQHPNLKTSYSSLLDARNRIRDGGKSSLLANYGRAAARAELADDVYKVWRALYMKEGAPSLQSTWRMALGYAHTHDSSIDVSRFPSAATFLRRLEAEIPREAIYRARYGAKAANRKFGFYIKRNYDDVLAGEMWVSDHCQIDVAVWHEKKPVFPWATVWRDYKTGKWVGWALRPVAPSSDPIFLAFYRAAQAHGIPSYVYTDNGKDYRCRDLTGGRRNVRVEIDEARARSLTFSLGIECIFAWPYNAQSKPVERDFLRNKEWFSKHAAGYRGGNVVEKPEALRDAIKSGGLETFEELERVFDSFVIEVINRAEVRTGHRAHRCPDEIWEAEAPLAAEKGIIRRVTSDALKLFCTRSSKDFLIGRRGVYDGEIGMTYFDDWMLGAKGRRVYLRRDPRSYQEAWVFDSANDEYMGRATLLMDAPALARTDIEREDLQESIRLRRKAAAFVRSVSKVDTDRDVPLREKVELLAAGTRILNEARGYVPAKENPTDNAATQATDMDRAIVADNARARRGLSDIQKYAPEAPEAESEARIDVLAPFRRAGSM